MGKVKVTISMSLDGYVAGPDQSEKNPLGIGGELRMRRFDSCRGHRR